MIKEYYKASRLHAGKAGQQRKDLFNTDYFLRDESGCVKAFKLLSFGIKIPNKLTFLVSLITTTTSSLVYVNIPAA